LLLESFLVDSDPHALANDAKGFVNKPISELMRWTKDKPSGLIEAGVDKQQQSQYLKDKQMAAAAVIKHQMSGMGMLEKAKVMTQIPIDLIPVITGKTKNAVFAETFQRLQDEAYAAGTFITLGLGKGIEAESNQPPAAIAKVGNSTITTMMNVLEEKSPSRVFFRIGKYITEGLGLGIIGGAAVGGLAGSTIGGGRGQDIATVLGAIGGLVAGQAIEEQANQREGLEITVKYDSGEMRVIVQEAAQFAQDSPEPPESELWTDILVETR
jgi:hypothetical protein